MVISRSNELYLTDEPDNMKAMKNLLMPLLFLFLISCTGERQEEERKQDLMEADRAFSELSRSAGMNQAFSTYCHPEGVLLRPGSYPVEGRNQVAALLQKNDDTGFQLTWEPDFATVARSGELGYTYGVFELQIKATGEIQRGTYVTVWRKSGGDWKFLLDSGNDGLGNDSLGE